MTTSSTTVALSSNGDNNDDKENKVIDNTSTSSEEISQDLPQNNVDGEILKSKVIFNPDTKTGFWGEAEEGDETSESNEDKDKPNEPEVNDDTETMKERSISANENDLDETLDWKHKDIKTHYIFLVHGWLGNDSEMSYIERALNKAKEGIKANAAKDEGIPRIAIYKVKENNNNTSDGIRKGGSRLANEILDFIREDSIEAIKNGSTDLTGMNGKKSYDVTISFIGNSLGGLYSRFAISLLPEELDAWIPNNGQSNFSESIMATKISLHSNIFCTTVTPHLGVASHTYLPLPRFAEQVVGRSMSTTGKHLFRIDSDGSRDEEDHEKDDLIYQMCTDYEQFLLPLSRFRKRIAYANAYGTDFQVPTNTASFVSVDSTYPHRIVKSSSLVDDDDNHEGGDEEEEEPYIVTAVSTDPNKDIIMESNCRKTDKNAILTMSNNLDALGWTKIFCDLRDKVPGPSIKVRKSSRRQDWDDFVQSIDPPAKSSLGKIVKSQDLARMMKGSESMNFPMGHSVLVANSKSKMYRHLNSKGKPVMDKMGKDFLNYMLNEM